MKIPNSVTIYSNCIRNQNILRWSYQTLRLNPRRTHAAGKRLSTRPSKRKTFRDATILSIEGIVDARNRPKNRKFLPPIPEPKNYRHILKLVFHIIHLPLLSRWFFSCSAFACSLVWTVSAPSFILAKIPVAGNECVRPNENIVTLRQLLRRLTTHRWCSRSLRENSNNDYKGSNKLYIKKETRTCWRAF